MRERVCPVYENLLGKHSFTATGNNCLETILRKTGDRQSTSESFDCLSNSLKLRWELLGKHPDTARSHHELALWNIQQANSERKKGKSGDRFPEYAKGHLNTAIEIDCEVIGAMEDTGGSLQKLAEICSSLGEDGEANKYKTQSEEMLDKFKKLRGNVACKVASPAETKSKQRRYSLAKSWMTVFLLGWCYVFLF